MLFRYWALAVPAYLMVTVVLALGFYLGLNFMSTPSPTSLNTVFGKPQLLSVIICSKIFLRFRKFFLCFQSTPLTLESILFIT